MLTRECDRPGQGEQGGARERAAQHGERDQSVALRKHRQKDEDCQQRRCDGQATCEGAGRDGGPCDQAASKRPFDRHRRTQRKRCKPGELERNG
ncbi:MAG: hypothetical protein EBT33_07955 [Betaproteobacteria bacterium]|nr:hypothetical protein [Betaproteobacteria bacterium]